MSGRFQVWPRAPADMETTLFSDDNFCERIGLLRSIPTSRGSSDSAAEGGFTFRWPDLTVVDGRRETRRFMAELEDHLDPTAPPDEQLAEVTVIVARRLRNQPLLHRLIETEPEAILPRLTVDGGPIIQAGAAYLAGHLERLMEIMSQPSQTLAGLRDALLQALSAPILTATDSTGQFYDDFAGRVALRAGELPLPLVEEGELPTTRAGLESLMDGWTDELYVTDLTRTLLDATVRLSGVPSPQRRLIRPFVLATLATISDDWHELLAPNQSRLEEYAAAQAVQIPLALMRLLLGTSPALDAATARVAADRVTDGARHHR